MLLPLYFALASQPNPGASINEKLLMHAYKKRVYQRSDTPSFCIYFMNYTPASTFGAADNISSFAWSAYLSKLAINNFASSPAFLS